MLKNMILIVPPTVPFDTLKTKSGKFSIKLRLEIPLGVLSIATYIRKFRPEFKIEIIDFNLIFKNLVENHRLEDYKSEKDIFEDYVNSYNYNPDCIGISCLFNTSYSYLASISRATKEANPDTLVLAGGVVPNKLYEQILKDISYIDAICIGEGELPILDLLDAEDVESYFKKSLQWATRKNLHNKAMYKPRHIQHLDEIPMLDYDLLAFDQYSQHFHGQDNKIIVSAPLMFSRGCPFHCCFCAAHSIHGRSVRYNSMERIKADISLLVNKYCINSISIWDDNFFADMSKTRKLLEFFRSKNLNIEFVNGLPVYRVDNVLAKELKDAGVNVVTLAIESGSQKVLSEIMHKPLKVEMVEKAIQILRQYDFYIKGLFVIGFPGESKEDIQDTISFIKKIDLDWVDIYIASPVIGSELYDICKNNGYLVDERIDASNFWKGNISTSEFTPKDIEKVQQFTILEVDFIQNRDLRQKNYKRALVNFEYCIKNHPDNAIAYYVASLCCEHLNEIGKYQEFKKRYEDILDSDVEWKKCFEYFGLM